MRALIVDPNTCPFCSYILGCMHSKLVSYPSYRFVLVGNDDMMQPSVIIAENTIYNIKAL